MITTPNYDEQFFLDSYTGGGGYLTGDYILRYAKETDEKYNRRRQLVRYTPFVKKVVNSYNAYLYKIAPNRTTTSVTYTNFTSNADGAGLSLNSVMRRAQKLSLITGTVFIIVDKPNISEPVPSKYVESLSSPYLSIRLPSTVESYTKDQFGRLTEIIFNEVDEDGRPRKRYFTRTSWKLVSEESITSGEHGLGEVPVVVFHSSEPLNDLDLTVPSWIQDLAITNLDIYNLSSELREQLRSNTFPILLIPERYSSEQTPTSSLTLGTQNALRYSPEDGAPSYLSPPSNCIEAFMKEIDRCIQLIYETSNLEYVSGRVGANASGVALKYYFQQTLSTLLDMAALCEDAEYKVARLVAKWMSEEFDGKITYNRDFDIEDLVTTLQLGMDALSINISETFEKEIKKSIARDVLGDFADQETINIIESEIDRSIITPSSPNVDTLSTY